MVGVITDKKGYNGEMYLSGLIADRLQIPEDSSVKIGYSEQFSRSYRLTYWKSGKRNAKLRIAGINDENQTRQFMEMGVFVDESVLKTGNPNTTFTHELIGLTAIDASNNKELGKVSDLLFLPANDVIVVEEESSLLHLPFIEQFIADIDIPAGRIVFNLPDGYEELRESKKGNIENEN
ncbi:MAG: ribosome maturation factor RimM [Candidatus Kapaibacterium sp.]